MRNSQILGVGHYVPERVVTNDDMAKFMDTSDEWIQQRTGIRERHFSEGWTGAADLGAAAAREALDRAGKTAQEMDCIIFATLSPDVDMPASACLLQDRLGVGNMPAFDVRNQCSGFLYGLAIADKFIKTGLYDNVLLVGGEVHSTGIDLTTRGRDVAVIFGDGAAAVVLGPQADTKRGILTTHLHAEGKFAEKLWLECPASRLRPRLTDDMVAGDDPRIFPKMEGRYVFRHAVERFPQVIHEALEATGLTTQDISLLIPHQANLRISQMVAMGLEIPEERVVNNIQRYGNTTAGSIPLALYEALADGRIHDGDLVCLAAFGAGFTWASALIRW
ncbi:MAG TPA: beta-ketoacyl-ACP synthase III [Candidatus Acidoferrales bacterium]|nr:beta-ketoacyl-ACP synthase III [Candidatus Acidoferrales bacterium]